MHMITFNVFRKGVFLIALSSFLRGKKAIKSNTRAIAEALAIVLCVQTFFFAPFYIPSGSMIPNLLVGDYLVVSKYTYGFSNHSFPLGRFLPDFGRIFSYHSVQRGDVVVFKNPQDTPSEDYYIKRVVGLPGDSIRLEKGVLYINNKPYPLEYKGPYREVAEVQGKTVSAYRYTQPLPLTHYQVIKHERPGKPLLDNTPTYEVPKNHYFFMGDNRDRSLDSRFLHDVGYIPHTHLVGRAELIFFSVNGKARWWESWKWPQSIRWGRFFQKVT